MSSILITRTQYNNWFSGRVHVHEYNSTNTSTKLFILKIIQLVSLQDWHKGNPAPGENGWMPVHWRPGGYRLNDFLPSEISILSLGYLYLPTCYCYRFESSLQCLCCILCSVQPPSWQVGAGRAVSHCLVLGSWALRAKAPLNPGEPKTCFIFRKKLNCVYNGYYRLTKHTKVKFIFIFKIHFPCPC